MWPLGNQFLIQRPGLLPVRAGPHAAGRVTPEGFLRSSTWRPGVAGVRRVNGLRADSSSKKSMVLREQGLRSDTLTGLLQATRQIELEITDLHLHDEVGSDVTLQVGMHWRTRSGRGADSLVRILECEQSAGAGQAAGRGLDCHPHRRDAATRQPPESMPARLRVRSPSERYRLLRPFVHLGQGHADFGTGLRILQQSAAIRLRLEKGLPLLFALRVELGCERRGSTLEPVRIRAAGRLRSCPRPAAGRLSLPGPGSPPATTVAR